MKYRIASVGKAQQAKRRAGRLLERLISYSTLPYYFDEILWPGLISLNP